jgi:hypothetical protein
MPAVSPIVKAMIGNVGRPEAETFGVAVFCIFECSRA